MTTITSSTICQNCGRPAKEHALANYADGPMIGVEVLICPTAVFKEKK
jgi:hypothetical protein